MTLNSNVREAQLRGFQRLQLSVRVIHRPVLNTRMSVRDLNLLILSSLFACTGL